MIRHTIKKKLLGVVFLTLCLAELGFAVNKPLASSNLCSSALADRLSAMAPIYNQLGMNDLASVGDIISFKYTVAGGMTLSKGDSLKLNELITKIRKSDGEFIFAITRDDRLAISERIPSNAEGQPGELTSKYVATHLGLYRQLAANQKDTGLPEIISVGRLTVSTGYLLEGNIESQGFRDRVIDFVPKVASIDVDAADFRNASGLNQDLMLKIRSYDSLDFMVKDSLINIDLQLDEFSRERETLAKAKSDQQDMSFRRVAFAKSTLTNLGIIDSTLPFENTIVSGLAGMHVDYSGILMARNKCLTNNVCQSNYNYLYSYLKSLAQVSSSPTGRDVNQNLVSLFKLENEWISRKGLHTILFNIDYVRRESIFALLVNNKRWLIEPMATHLWDEIRSKYIHHFKE